MPVLPPAHTHHETLLTEGPRRPELAMHRTRLALTALLFTLALLVPVAGLANTVEALPDRVELLDGSQVRGTILERHGDGSVILRDYLGDLRHIDGAAIRHAGPVEVETVTPRPVSIWEDRRGNRLRITVDERFEHLEVHRVLATTATPGHLGSSNGGGGSWRFGWALQSRQHLCTGSCETVVASGHHQIHVRAPSGYPFHDVRPLAVDLTQDSTLHLEVKSRRALRWTTGVAALGSFIVGSVLIANNSDRLDDDSWNAGMTGLALLGSGLVFSAATITIPNRVRPTAVPLAEASE